MYLLDRSYAVISLRIQLSLNVHLAAVADDQFASHNSHDEAGLVAQLHQLKLRGLSAQRCVSQHRYTLATAKVFTAGLTNTATG